MIEARLRGMRRGMRGGMSMRTWVGIVLGAALSGCAPLATYPPIEEGGKLTTPLMEPFPSLMAEGIWFTHSTYGDTSAEFFYYNLPPGTPPEVFLEVSQRLGIGRPQQDPAQPAYEVKSVRARGIEAEVDVIYPRSDGLYGLVTVSFRRDLMKGWLVSDTRVWRIPVEPDPPSYIPPIEGSIAGAPKSPPR